MVTSEKVMLKEATVKPLDIHALRVLALTTENPVATTLYTSRCKAPQLDEKLEKLLLACPE